MTAKSMLQDIFSSSLLNHKEKRNLSKKVCSDLRSTETGRQRDWRLSRWSLKTAPNIRQQIWKEQPTHKTHQYTLLTQHKGSVLFSPNNPVIFYLILTIEPFFFYMYTTRTFPLSAVAKTTTEIALRAQFYLVFLYVGLKSLNIYLPSY